jgi:hypothetical protein
MKKLHGKRFIEVFNAIETNRNLRIDDGVNQQD